MTPPPAAGAGVAAAPVPPRPGRALAAGVGAGLLAAGVAGLMRAHGAPVSPARIGVEVAILVAILGFLAWRALRGPGAARGDVPKVAAGALDGEGRARLLAHLRAVQRAWTLRDLDALGRLCTPEMVGMFADQLRDLERRGARNSTSRVELLEADLAEGWREDGCAYETLALRYRMIDITTDPAGRVLAGDPAVPREVRELWTLRRGSGEGWMLSAIQQG